MRSSRTGKPRRGEFTKRGMTMKKAIKESDETPQMEARSHSTKFLRSAVKAKLSTKSASGIRTKVKKAMGGY